MLEYEFTQDGILYKIRSVDAGIIGFDDNIPASVVIPDEIRDHYVTFVANDAFANCHKLKEIVLPKTCYEIQHRAFCGCINLKKVECQRDYGLTFQIDSFAFYGCHNLTNVNFRNSDLLLWLSAFEGCKNLQYFVGNILYAHENAFADCHQVAQLNICDGANIAYTAFNGCIPREFVFQGTLQEPFFLKEAFFKDSKYVVCSDKFPWMDAVYQGYNIVRSF